MKTKKPSPIKALFRLTLTDKAYLLAEAKSRPLIGGVSIVRPDGKIDCMIKSATANLLRQLAVPGENLSDTVIRILGGSK